MDAEKGELETASQLPIFLRPREVKSLAQSHTAASLRAPGIQLSDFSRRTSPHGTWCLHLRCISATIWGTHC